ncbi:Gfo/Idh/MocA family protein [Jiangella asiatica]|uniref:Gfo/Idh/MocA family oxidoreductase n=1 Tax=Jiangella asiatica TaxID=2530372 RepID=A0A4R5DGQ6_9ACTN|nr:Gfo/Idh/MocA family oxidoreductase [Jiangella asiatica]TDE09905.1 Gfo/Idh/MocA family oxidoreductase [Jiangella asiatica]
MTAEATRPYRVIQVGTGGMGMAWCRHILPPFVADGRIEVVAAVDVNADALPHATEGLGLEPERCYTDLAAALANHPADICTIVVPPAFHETVVDAALEHGMHIFSEKPIADTLEASARIAAKVQAAGRKMSVTMSHRFDQDKTTLREELASGRNGTLDYLVGRFTSANRRLNSWGAFRHQMADPLMIEGAIHHLDILVDLAGARCATVSALTWNPAWGEYKGDSEGMVLMEFENGVRALYEGAKATAVGLNGWGQEYVRAECENATVIMDRRRIQRYTPDNVGADWVPVGEEVPLLDGERWGHFTLLEDFLAWLDGGPVAPTAVDENLHSTAVMFAAIESSRRHQTVDVAEFLEQARAAV